MDQRWLGILIVVAAWIVVRTLFGKRRTQPRSSRSIHKERYEQQRVRPAIREKRPLIVGRNKSPLLAVASPPHSFAHRGLKPGTWYDLSQDGRNDELVRRGLPVFQTPDELAAWLNVPVNRLAWLAYRCTRGNLPGVSQSHYVYTWKPKRTYGYRLIESPKASLKTVQRQILTEILDHLLVSEAAHGFRKEHSILTNAQLHVNAAVVVKFDLSDFYLTVRSGRITNLLRRVGYSREVAIWLTRLTTSTIPGNLPPPPTNPIVMWNYRQRHLPQGAPSSPALANLVAYRLDQRLLGLAKSFGANYTRYADDLTFSGDESFAAALRAFIPLVEAIIRRERFQSNNAKRQILRRHQRQIVAGVVVNEKPNFCRKDFDRLKAILHRCVTQGPAAQNRDQIEDFAAHLRGRIAHVRQLNPQRALKLESLFQRIDWRR
ncbi:RNA-directed DNA polymerase [bacterium]|nr:RNA-directed DNA polymerase [bacterium]